jgi:energy coupling factor transporter S component ThiW
MFQKREMKPMKNTNTKKLAIAGLFCAVAIVGSLFSFPVLGSKCAPVQHMINILCAVLLGPGYGVTAAFAAALIRNLLGLGSLMAFPGSMIGALICGIVYKKTGSIPGTLIGEVFGTGILGGLCAYPVAILFMGQSAAGIAFYAYVVPFLISTAAGAIISALLLFHLKRTGSLKKMQESIEK